MTCTHAHAHARTTSNALNIVLLSMLRNPKACTKFLKNASTLGNTNSVQASAPTIMDEDTIRRHSSANSLCLFCPFMYLQDESDVGREG